MLIFGVRRLLSLKNCQMRRQNSFLRFSMKIQLFSKKLSNKKIFSIKFLIKKAIFIFGIRLPWQVAQWHSWTCYKQSKKPPSTLTSMFRNLSSDALPAPEIFFCKTLHWHGVSIMCTILELERVVQDFWNNPLVIECTPGNFLKTDIKQIWIFKIQEKYKLFH